MPGRRAMVIAIDGPAASGKGTLAKRLAAHLGLPHLDTGLLYRATARALLDAGLQLDDPVEAARAARRLAPVDLEEHRLRGRELGEAASRVAAIGGVRDALMKAQADFAALPGGAVLDGRDIGTVIAPHADVKIYVTATPEARARRRALELTTRGEPADFQAIFEDVRSRDERDTNRAAAPLRSAEDAVLLDTTELDIDAVFQCALSIIKRRCGPGMR